MKIHIFLFTLLISFSSFSQKGKEDEIFTAVEKQAEFLGGMGAFNKFLQKHLPNLEKEFKAGINGKISVQFVVDIDGSVADISLLKTFMFPETEAAFIEKLRKDLTQKWSPALSRGKPIRSRFTIPIFICSE